MVGPNVEARRAANPLWARVVFVIWALVLVLVFYAILRDPNAPRNALAPAPGAVPLPDAPTSTNTTGQRVPLPGGTARAGPGREDRAAAAEARTALEVAMARPAQNQERR
jgi:hypothetical protein